MSIFDIHLCLFMRLRFSIGGYDYRQAALARQALGNYLDIMMAPQPLGPSGPMAQSLLTTTRTQDAQSISFPRQIMNMHEVPFYSISMRTLSRWNVYLVRKILGNDQRTFQQAYQNTLPNKFLVSKARIRKSQMPRRCGPVHG